ncbi:MAG: DNA polymerase I [Bacillota bacterium]
MKLETPDKLIVVDGNSLIYRAFYALPLLQNSRGEHTNAVYGFTGMLLKLLEDEKPAYIAVAMDYPAPSFRNRIYEHYKGHREKTPAELGEQVLRIREIMDALCIPVFEVEGFEADDIIGTLAGLAAERAMQITVVTGDADLLQLVGGPVTVMLTRKGISQMDRYDRESLLERFGLEPSQMIDFKALKGDPSDNIPGVPGIGDKTARRLLEQYGSLERLYAARGELSGKVAENLDLYREQLFTGRELVTLCNKVPLDISWEKCRFQPDYSRLLELFDDLEFKSLAARVRNFLPQQPAGVDEPLRGELVLDQARLGQLLGALAAGDNLSLLFESPPGRPYWREQLPLIALAAGEDHGFYLYPESFKPGETAAWNLLAQTWARGVDLICSDAKFLYNYLEHRGVRAPEILFDVRLAAYLLEPTRGSYDLPQLLKEYLGLPLPADPPERGKCPLTPEQQGNRLATWACSLHPLREKLKSLLAERSQLELYHRLELPISAVLARMERQGLAVDQAFLGELALEIRGRLESLEEEIYALAGERFNLNSPQQLSAILFEKLQLPVVRKTKTGRSTDARVLEELAPRHEIVAKLLHYRQLIKLEGTYLSGLAPLVDPVEKKIYTTLNQTVTATGRLSSSEPNLQNIPIRLEEGRRIRLAFIPSAKEQVFLTADYSQIELRIMAHLSQDPILLEAFRHDEDIHRRTAAEVFSVAPEAVTGAMRNKAKAVNFGIIYGISDYGLAQSLAVSRQEARQYIESYFDRYTGVKRYVEEMVESARQTGYVATLMNRRRYLPELRSANYGRRGFAERVARNAPIQGSAADIIKLAMLQIDKLIREGGFKARMLLQIHDDLLFEVDQNELAFFAPVVRREMEEAVELSVPLRVDLKWGCNWAELEPLEN